MPRAWPPATPPMLAEYVQWCADQQGMQWIRLRLVDLFITCSHGRQRIHEPPSCTALCGVDWGKGAISPKLKFHSVPVAIVLLATHKSWLAIVVIGHQTGKNERIFKVNKKEIASYQYKGVCPIKQINSGPTNHETLWKVKRSMLSLSPGCSDGHCIQCTSSK